ncbi:hypothetical protein [Croceicoccus sp. YJ47]|uniref:hypothetical protein n=1 Tax=Croceicoccus sp. YJ47 TaxID=2798724 RepID=UPI001923FE7E|nr:hypothetical protein [Croceicoccus sp. YJ47]QQN75037.1 hypothetical protein JD971_04895 [Croceicoccus sp. YJ47]
MEFPPRVATEQAFGQRPIPPKLPLPKEEHDDQTGIGMRKAMFPLDEGDVTLIFPEGISADGLGDLADYLEIFLKKERRNREQSN